MLTKILDGPIFFETNTKISPGIPNWSKPLPKKLHIGKKVKVKSGTWIGRSGKIKNHYINIDDCSGNYGEHMYSITQKNGENFCYPVKDCEL